MSPVIYLGRQVRTLPRRCYGEGGLELPAVRRCHAPVSTQLRGQLSLFSLGTGEYNICNPVLMRFSFVMVWLFVLPGSDCSSLILSTTLS